MSRVFPRLSTPGMIDTLQNRESIPDADFTTWVTPESLAEVILFLSSGAARDVHSAALPVFGRGVEGDFQALNILLSDKMKAFSLKSAIISVIEKNWKRSLSSSIIFQENSLISSPFLGYS